MMGGVLEVKKEDILRMVRFLVILVEGGMGWKELLKCDHFFPCEPELQKFYSNKYTTPQYLINLPHQAKKKKFETPGLPSNLMKSKQMNNNKKTTTVVWVSTESRDNTAPLIFQIHQETFPLIPDIGIPGAQAQFQL